MLCLSIEERIMKPKNHKVEILAHSIERQKVRYTCLSCGKETLKIITDTPMFYDIFSIWGDNPGIVSRDCECEQ